MDHRIRDPGGLPARRVECPLNALGTSERSATISIAGGGTRSSSVASTSCSARSDQLRAASGARCILLLCASEDHIDA
jgi:hypothetical protein